MSFIPPNAARHVTAGTSPGRIAPSRDGKRGGMSSFVVVANRLPVDEVITETGRTWRRSPGGLVTALHPVLTERHGSWIGWSGGITEEDELAATGGMPDPMNVDGLELCSVPLTADDIERYYEGFSNGSLWPLYHDAV